MSTDTVMTTAYSKKTFKQVETETIQSSTKPLWRTLNMVNQKQTSASLQGTAHH